MRVQDIVQRLQGKVDPDVIQVLCYLHDKNREQRKQMIELAKMFNQLAEIVNRVATVSQSADKLLEQIAKREGIEAQEFAQRLLHPNVTSIMPEADKQE